MSFVKTTAIALAIALGSSSAVLAKAHDQGVEEGGRIAGDGPSDGTGPIGPGGVSAAVAERGDTASTLRSGLRQEPVVGANAD